MVLFLYNFIMQRILAVKEEQCRNLGLNLAAPFRWPRGLEPQEPRAKGRRQSGVSIIQDAAKCGTKVGSRGLGRPHGSSPELCPNPSNETHAYAQMHMNKHTKTEQITLLKELGGY